MRSADHTAAPGRPRFFRARTAFAFSAPLIVNGIALPFFPVWLAALHFSDRDIGVALAVPMVARVLSTPVLSALADRTRERADVLLWSGLLSLLATLVLWWTADFWPVLLVTCLQGVAYAPYMPVVESVAMAGVRRWGLDYGWMRVWGSIAFVLTTFAGGAAIGLWGGASVLPMMAAGFVLTVAAALAAPRLGSANGPVPRDGGKSPSPIRDPRLLLTMVGVSVQQASHAVLYAFASIQWHAAGFSGAEIGLFWSVGVVAEVLVFFLSGPLLRRFGAPNLVAAGSVASVVRWLLFPVGFGFAGTLALQCLHGLTFAAVHIGVQRRIVTTVAPEAEATAQGAYYFHNGMCMGLATLGGGYLYAFAGTGSYYVMAGLAAAGFLLALRGRPTAQGTLSATAFP